MIARQRLDFHFLAFRHAGNNQVRLAVIRNFRPDSLSRSPAGRFSTDVWVIGIRPFSINSVRCQLLSIPFTQPIRSPRPVTARADRLKLIPARRSTSAFKRLQSTRSGVYLVWRFYDRYGYPSHAGSSPRFRLPRYAQRRGSRKLAGWRARRFLTVLNRQTAANQQVKPTSCAVFSNRHEVHVVGVQIDISFCGGITTVVLNFTRQIGLRPRDHGSSSVVATFSDRARSPHRREVRGGRCSEIFLRPFVGFSVKLRLVRVRGTQHVTVHIVGGRQRVQPDRMQHLVHQRRSSSEYCVKLEGLAVGQTDTAAKSCYPPPDCRSLAIAS